MTLLREYIQCGACGARSYHPKDIEEKFCGACRKWHASASEYELGAIADPLPDGWEHTGATHCTHVSGACVWHYGGAGGLRLWAWQSQSGPGVTIDPDGFAPTRADAMRCACRDAIGELLKLPNIVELDAQLPPPDFEIIDTDAYWAKLDEAVRSRMLYIAMHKEHLLEAWIAETGIKPSEASLIMAEHFDPDRGMVTKISVERRLLPIIVEDAESIRNAGRLEMLNAVLHELGETSGTFAAIGSPAITRLDLLMQQLADCFRKPGFGGRK